MARQGSWNSSAKKQLADTAGIDNFTSDYLPSSSFVTVMAVPEPATLTLVGIGAGLAALAAVAFRRM